MLIKKCNVNPGFVTSWLVNWEITVQRHSDISRPKDSNVAQDVTDDAFASLFRGVQLSYPVFGVATSIFTAIFTTYPNIILVASYIPVYSHDIPNLTSLGRTVVLIFTGQSILKHKKNKPKPCFFVDSTICSLK